MVTSKYALLDGATCVAVILWDGNTQTYNPAPLTAVPYNPAVHVVATEPTTLNATDLAAKLQQALDVNANFLGVASPTNAQTLAQVQRLTRECSALIRLALNALDTTTGT